MCVIGVGLLVEQQSIRFEFLEVFAGSVVLEVLFINPAQPLSVFPRQQLKNNRMSVTQQPKA
jgi:hypothetical protein